MAVKYFCDRCSKEVGSLSNFFNFSLTDDVSRNDDYSSSNHELKDISKINSICLNCTRNIVCFVKNPFAFSNNNVTGIKEKE